MAINFPDAPSLNQEHTVGSTTWKWDGTVWNALGVTVSSIVVADESADTTCFPLFATAATGAIEPKTGTNLTFNSSTGQLGATSVRATDSGSADYIDISTNATNSVINQSGGSSMVFQTGGVNRFGVGPDYTWGTVSHIIQEKAAATADIASYGQLWVMTATPNQLYFTGDTGVDIQITDATGIAAASISSGNLGSGVLPYSTASATSSAFKIPFLNTTGTASGNYALLQDSTATFTYNPSTNQFAVGNIITTGDITVNSGSVDVDQDAKFFSTRFDLYNTNSDVILHNKGTGSGSDTFFTMNNSLSYEGIVIRNLAAVELYYADVLQFDTQNYTATGATTGARVLARTFGGGGLYYDVGMNELFKYNDNVSDTLEGGHCGAVAFKDVTTGYTLTLEASSSLDFPVNGMTTVINAFTSTAYTITEGTSTTLYYLDGTTRVDTAGGCTVGPGGVANIWREAAGIYYIWGTGITP